MKKRILLFGVLTLFVATTACNNEAEKNWQPFSLLSYGYPISVLAPDSVTVKTEDFIVQKGVEIKDEDQNYFIQLWITDISVSDMERLKAEKMVEVEEADYFSKIVHEEDSGFVFEKVQDSTLTYYDFRYIKLKGNSQFVFRVGLGGTFPLEAVEKMYEAVKYESYSNDN